VVEGPASLAVGQDVDDNSHLAMISIRLNGESREIPSQLNLRSLLLHFSIDPDRVAIEMNRTIVRKPEWESTLVTEGAEIEVVQFVGGGSAPKSTVSAVN
jgi:thiamine biosynthesis protein ThiS